MLRTQLRPAILVTLLLCVVTGGLYPAIVTAITQLVFPRQANGSVVEVNGRPVGSALIAQGFTRPEYFHPRPSAAGDGYDAASSAGTNRGPTDRKLADTLIAGSVAQVRREDGVSGPLPSDLVTRSASGLDPHISPASAALQVRRVAAARGADRRLVEALVRRHTEGPQLGLFGDPRVNVLMLNLDLDRELPMRRAEATR